ncbi:MAG TPA: transglycosylase SLT domain-containing protein [Thermoanaerobaculia bacterium]|nr:transglycosylase SLT domain-containing protein [Thermoanaerobaculia bacterium]
MKCSRELTQTAMAIDIQRHGENQNGLLSASAVLALILLTAACTTAPQRIETAPGPHPASAADLESYRGALEEAIEAQRSRQELLDSAPFADAAATASIELPSHPSITGAVDYFSGTLKPKIQASLVRSSSYKANIDRILAEEGVPRALSWLPVIESAFIPTLTSRAGAHGLWQFMPATAREYGLRVDWWIDERADPDKSTRAAAHYLRDLHRMFGDWSLALAAYNCGPGRLRKTLAREQVTTFWELHERAALPKETRGYVPTFWATLQIVSDPAAHGFDLAEPKPQPRSLVEVEGPVTLDHIAAVAGIEPAILTELNPELHRGLVPPGVHKVRVPEPAAPLIAEAGGRLRHDDPALPVTRFVTRSGDSVTALAKLLQVDPDDILGINGLRSAALPAGREVLLPVPATTLSLALERQRSSPPSFYTVEKGDTLYAIARRKGLTLEELMELNGVSSDSILQPGDRLRVSRPASAVAGN